VKEFWSYTALRIGMFLASAALVFGVWAVVADQVPVLWVVVIAFAISGVASYFLLNRQREAFARRVDERARRVSERFEGMKAKEDAD
jgi:membrane protein implicated in regulation of membrane protease activity